MWLVLVPAAITKIKNTFGHKHKWKLKHSWKFIIFASLTSPYMENFICLRRFLGQVMKKRRGEAIPNDQGWEAAGGCCASWPWACRTTQVCRLTHTGSPLPPSLFLGLHCLKGHVQGAGRWVGFKPICPSAGLLAQHSSHMADSADFLELCFDLKHF